MTTPEAPRTRAELHQRLLSGLLFQLDNGVPEAGAHLLALLRDWPDAEPSAPPGEALADPLTPERAPAYEDIGPWDEAGGVATRVDLRPDGMGCVAHIRSGLPRVWNTWNGEWEVALSREAADVRLRELYPPRRVPPRGHPDLDVGPTCPTCGQATPRKLSGVWLCRTCPTAAGEAYGPADAELRRVRELERWMEAHEQHESEERAVLAGRCGSLEERVHELENTLAAQRDQYRRLLEPAGPIAPPLGEHVERVAERKAVVAWLRKFSGIAYHQLATNIERGEHLS